MSETSLQDVSIPPGNDSIDGKSSWVKLEFIEIAHSKEPAHELVRDPSRLGAVEACAPIPLVAAYRGGLDRHRCEARYASAHASEAVRLRPRANRARDLRI